MKRVCIILAGWLALFLSSAAGAAELRMGASSWPPYAEQTLPGQGLGVEIVMEALRRAGYQSSVSFVNWSRTLEGARIGIVDVIPCIWATPERGIDLVFSEPYFTNDVMLVKRRDAAFTFDELYAGRHRNLTMGVVRDYAYPEVAERFDYLPTVTRNYMLQNLLKLKQGEIDFTLGDDLALRYHLREYMRADMDRVEFSAAPLSRKPLRIAVSKKTVNHAEIIAAFDKAVEEMRSDGSLEALVAKYR